MALPSSSRNSTPDEVQSGEISGFIEQANEACQMRPWVAEATNIVERSAHLKNAHSRSQREKLVRELGEFVLRPVAKKYPRVHAPR